MIRTLHPIAGIIAFLTILTFWVSTVAVEFGGNAASIAAVKTGILWGLLLLVPAIATAGATGFRLGGRSPHPRIVAKKARMPVIALNGILVLIPCAVLLQQRAAAAQFDATFYGLQALELAAGALNLLLIGRSIRDGLALSRGTTSPAT